MSNFAITQDDKEVTGKSPIGVGIHENVTFTGPSFEALKEGNPPVLQLNFKDESGRTHNEVMWEPDPERIKEYATKYPKQHTRDDAEKGYVKGEEITPEQAVEIDFENFRVRLKHVATKFVDEQDIIDGTADATSYEDFVKKYIALFTDEALESGNPVRLKLPPNKQGYATLPKYPPFIENMEVPALESRLQFNNYEKGLIAQSKETNATDPETFDDPTDFDPATFEDEAGF